MRHIQSGPITAGRTCNVTRVDNYDTVAPDYLTVSGNESCAGPQAAD